MIFIPAFVIKGFVLDLLMLRSPLKRYSEKKKKRGMSMFYDWIDWLGGYPFEFSTTERLIDFYYEDGFFPTKLNQTKK